jgi:hypothetical protein
MMFTQLLGGSTSSLQVKDASFIAAVMKCQVKDKDGTPLVLQSAATNYKAGLKNLSFYLVNTVANFSRLQAKDQQHFATRGILLVNNYSVSSYKTLDDALTAGLFGPPHLEVTITGKGASRRS